MNSKKWVFKVLLFSLSLMLLIELKFQLIPGNRHVVDYLVNEYIPSLVDEKYDTIIIGDSLANHAFSNVILRKNILDLTSIQSITMAGNYFLLNRYLKKNRTPKEIYLFCIPDFLYEDLDSIYTYGYFESVFTNESEIAEIKNIKPNLYNMEFDINKFFEQRKQSINLGGYHPNKRIKHIHINNKELRSKPDYMNLVILNRIKRVQRNKNSIKEIPKIYLNKIIELCKKENISFTLIVEPTPKEINSIFKTSRWNEYLLNKDMNYFNINDFYSFSTYFFRYDGTHISGKVNQFYQSLIDKYIVDIY